METTAAERRNGGYIYDWKQPPEAIEEAVGSLKATHASAAACTACALHKNRSNPVFGVGHANAALMFVGEGPGPDEDKDGEPFTGRSGQLLDRIIAAMGARRENVFLTNIVTCQWTCQLNDSRQLLKSYIEACRPHLEAQIATVAPHVIVALGSSAWTWFHRKDKRRMADVRGAVYRWRDKLLVPAYHPAFLLRMPHFKRDVWHDVQVAAQLLEGNENAGGDVIDIDESAWIPEETASLFD